MTDDDEAQDEAEKLGQHIDRLMDAPAAERPTIIVVGDDAVTSITLPAPPVAPED